MNAIGHHQLSRRGVLKGGGALILSFSLAGTGFAQEAAAPEKPELPGDLQDTRFLDSWIRIDGDGAVTVFTGKAELGQGLRTAILQIAAEELGLDIGDIELVTADTGRTPDEGFTAGSNSMPESGTAVRHAAAQVREILIAEAASRLGLSPNSLRAEKGAVVAPDGQKLGYGALVAGELLHVEAKPTSVLTDPKSFRVMGHPVRRVDIPAKVTGGVAYVHDLRLPGMVHARIIRPPSPAATLVRIDERAANGVPGVLKLVRDGNFLAVVAEREFDAVKAMRLLAASAEWNEPEGLPGEDNIHQTIQNLPATDLIVKDERGAAPREAVRGFEAVLTRPYQMHGSIEPSCAVAQLKDGAMTVWSHTQGVYPDREAIAEMLAMPIDKVRLIHMEGAGCYGHNGADDAAADAALVARAIPGRPVRVQWMREQEHAWEPYGPAMVTKVRAGLGDDGTITAWDYEVWSNPHSSRPGPAGALLPARHLASPFSPEIPEARTSASGSGDRNAVPLYRFPNTHVVWHFLADMPVRVSALRALGAYMNVFSIEGFMDGLAAAADTDPVEFRLRHLDDPRGRDVIERAASEFGWSTEPLPQGRGRGFGSPGTRTSPPISPSRARLMWSTRPAGRGWCARWRRSTAARWSTRMASETRARAASCSR